MTSAGNKISRNVLHVIRIGLCCTFLYAAILKGSAFAHFTAEMKKSPLLESNNTVVVGIGILVLEFAAALLLSFRSSLRAGLLVSYFLMFLFSVYLSILYFNYPNAPCSCGGILGRLSYPVHIAFNISLTALSVVGLFLKVDHTSSEESVAATHRTTATSFSI